MSVAKVSESPARDVEESVLEDAIQQGLARGGPIKTIPFNIKKSCGFTGTTQNGSESYRTDKISEYQCEHAALTSHASIDVKSAVCHVGTGGRPQPPPPPPRFPWPVPPCLAFLPLDATPPALPDRRSPPLGV
jgi:hypothetical protein